MDEDLDGAAPYGKDEPLLWQAKVCLTGELMGGPSDISLVLIRLLQSDENVDRDLRCLLADSLKRGLFGNREEALGASGRLLPRIVVEGLGRDGAVSEAVNSRRTWLDAAGDLIVLRERGERGEEPINRVAHLHGLGVAVMKKAVKLLNRFHAEISDPESPIVCQTLNYFRSNYFDPGNEDHYYFARSLFIESDARFSIKRVSRKDLL